MRRLEALGWSSLITIAGCIVPAVDLDGKPCPCVDGWVCDASTKTCRRVSAGTSTTADDGSTSMGMGTSMGPGSGEGEGEEDSTGTAPALLSVVEFSADWSTPQSIHWRWEVTGDETGFHAYELWVATAAEDLDDASTAVVFDGTLNPELDRFSLANTMGVDFVRGTITDGLQPSTEYFAQLHVLDTAGGVSFSPNVAVRSTTAPPTNELVIFSEDAPVPGLVLPECMQRVDTTPAAGTYHYELVVRCSEAGESICTDDPAPAPECFENLRLQDLDLPPPNIGGGDFADAFVEVSVAVEPPDENPAHGWWSDFSVQGAGQWSGIHGITVRADGAYRRYQFPLTQLELTVDTFTGVEGFRVGSTWRHGAAVRFDEVRLRW